MWTLGRTGDRLSGHFIFLTVAAFIFSMFTKETYKKIIRKYRAKANGEPLQPGPSGFALLKFIIGVVLFRPIHMLLTEPIVISFAVYISFNFAILFRFLTLIPLIFSRVYNFSNAQSGLPFIAIAVGCLLSLLTRSLLGRTLYQQKQHRKCVREERKGIPPEYRLYGAMVGSIGLLISLFWFARTSQKSVHWIVPIMGLVPLPGATSPSLFPVFYTL
jgi:hypothetical protein